MMPARRSPARLARALVAAAGLLMLLVAVPAVLARTADAVQWPAITWPNFDDSPFAPPLSDQVRPGLRHAATELRLAADDGSLVIIVVLGVGWTSWALVLWWTVCDIFVHLRLGARAARRHVSVTGPRGWITALVTSLLLTGAPHPTHATPAASDTVATAPRHPGTPTEHTNTDKATSLTTAGYSDPPALALAPGSPAAQPAHQPRYLVRPGDTLWTLAQRHLGDPQRWHEIAALNMHRVPDPDLLRPGTVLRLPADAVGLPPLAAGNGGMREIVVQPGQTLARIAEHELGDSQRWPELVDLNAGRTQPDGLSLGDPDILLPGWTLLVPPSAHPPTPPQAPEASPRPRPSPPSAPTPAPVDQHPPKHHPPAVRLPDAKHGITTGSGALVSVSLAAAITAAFAVVWARRRRRYRPGSGAREDLTIAPIVRTLHLTHHEAPSSSDASNGDDPRDTDTDVPDSPHHNHTGHHDHDDQPATVDEVSDTQWRALALARSDGLGLNGPGAAAVTRALLVTLLADRHLADDHTTTVLIPRGDLTALFGHHQVRLPSQIQVADTVDAAVDTAETELTRRTRTQQQGHPLLVLVATPDATGHQRLRCLMRRGSAVNIAGLFTGPWPPGATLHIGPDGMIRDASVHVAESFGGMKLSHLPVADARDLLDLLREAAPEDAASGQPERNLGKTSLVPGGPTAGEPMVPPTQPYSATSAPAPAATSGTEAAPRGPYASGEATPTQAGTPCLAGTSLELTDSITSRPPDSVETEATSAAVPFTDSADVPEPPDHASAAEPAGTDWQPPPPPLRFTVLGPTRMDYQAEPEDTRDITGAFSPRQRELLVYLAIHPDGIGRDTLITTLWSDHSTRPATALNTALSRLRRNLAQATDDGVADLVVNREGRYHLDPGLAAVDFWDFTRALAARRAATTDAARIAANERIVAAYTGRLADDLDVEWIEPAREATRRDFLDAVAALARAHAGEHPQRVLDLLETARAFDPYNELLYRDIMRLHDRLGQHEAIGRTLHLLATRLAEINDEPSVQAVELAARLQHRADARSGSEQ